ncbi:MAG TPA: TetR/AcrR family transcriptional regulator [Kineosporiaceae bacterium]|nr:TetR/AcrR family transcriptional regulator [Kineosporiaceae bacterium]
MATERSPKRRPDDGRRAQLIEAATRVVATDGVAAATTRRIAEEAGVPHGLVHYWFSGKDELLEEVVQNMLRRLEEAVADPVPSPPTNDLDDLTQRFRSAFAVVEADDSGRQIALYELTTWSLRSRKFRDVARAQYAAYRASAEVMVQPWQAEHLAGMPVSTEIFAQFIATLFDGVNLAWLADPEGTKPDEIFAFVAALLSQFAAAATDGSAQLGDQQAEHEIAGEPVGVLEEEQVVLGQSPVT